MLASAAVAEVMPESASMVVIPPDEVVDALGGDAEVAVGHDDLVGAEIVFESLDDDLGQGAGDFEPGL